MRCINSGRNQLLVILLPIFLICLRLPVYSQQVTLTGTENQSIALSDAVKLTQNYRTAAPSASVIAEFFGRTALLNILSQNGCIGIRAYYGKKDDGTPALVLVGMSAAGFDLTNGPLTERGFPCPPVCDTTSALGGH